MLYIILKQVIWKLRIYNLFRYIKKAFMNFAKSIIVYIFTIFEHFVKQTKLYILILQITYFKMIYNMSKLDEAEIFFEKRPKFDIFAKFVHKIAKSKYFVDISKESDSRIIFLFNDIHNFTE